MTLLTPTELCQMLRDCRRPGVIHMWLASAQLAWLSHGNTGPCPCWMCETRRSYLSSLSLPTYGSR